MTAAATALEQTVFLLKNGELRELGRSPGFGDIPLADVEAERLCRGFGTLPAGIACPLAVFAQPFGSRHVAVVQAADHPVYDLVFRVIVLPRNLYAGWIADPFLVSECFPPDWTVKGELPALSWPAGPSALTTLERLQHALQTGGSQTLLGAVQALIDGGRLVFERPAPATQFLRDLWQLLPYSTRAELWPADFAFSNALGFDVLVVPKADGLPLGRYLTEEQAVDYPHGRYEFGLQYAVEHGDQRELDRLLHRRTSKQTLRLVVCILVGGVLLYLGATLMARLL